MDLREIDKDRKTNYQQKEPEKSNQSNFLLSQIAQENLICTQNENLSEASFLKTNSQEKQIFQITEGTNPQTRTIEVAQETSSYAGMFFQGIKNLAGAAYNKVQEGIAAGTSLATQAANSAYNKVQEGISIGTSKAYQAVISGAVTGPPVIIEAVTGPWGMDYAGDMQKYGKNITNKMGFSGINAILFGLAPDIEPQVYNKISSGSTLKKEIGTFFDNNPGLLKQLVEVALFHAISDMIDLMYVKWKEEAKDLPFGIYFMNTMVERYDRFASEIEKIVKIQNPQERQTAWKARVAEPLINGFLQDYFPKGIEAILPLPSAIAKVLAYKFLPGIKEEVGNYLIQAHEYLLNPEKGAELAKDKRDIDLAQGGTQLLEYIDNSVNELMIISPQFVVPVFADKAANFLAKNAVSETGNKEELSKELKGWLEQNIQGTVDRVQENSNVWKIAESAMKGFLTKISAHLLREAYKKNGSAEQNALDAVFKEFSSFFSTHQTDLLAFEDYLKTLSANQRTAAINEKYGALFSELLTKIGVDKDPLIATVKNFSPDLFPAYLHSVYTVVSIPSRNCDALITEISDLAFTTQGSHEEDKKFIKNTSEAVSSIIADKSKEIIIEEKKFFIESIEAKLDKPLRPEAKKILEDTLDGFADKNNASAKIIWKQVETFIQFGLLSGAKNFLEETQKAQTNPSQKVPISEAIIHMAGLLNSVGPDIEQVRLIEFQRHRLALKNAVSDKEVAAENALHAGKLQKIYQPLVQKFIAPVTSVESQEALAKLLPPELQGLAAPILNLVLNDLVPKTIGKMHEQTTAYQDRRDVLRAQLTERFKSNMPVLLAHTGAEYAKQWIFEELKKKPENKQLSSTSRVDQALEAASTAARSEDFHLVEEIVDAISSFFETNGAVFLGPDKTAAQKTAEYIISNKAEIINTLRANLLAAGKSPALSNALDVSTEFVEGILLQVFLGMHETIVAQEAKDPAIMARVFTGILRSVREKLEIVNHPEKSSKPSAPETKNQWIESILNKVGITRENIPIPDQLKKVIWPVLTEKALPAAFSSVIDNFATEKAFKKMVKGTLEEYRAIQKAEKAAIKKARQVYNEQKADAMKTGKPIPPKPVIEKQIKHPHVKGAEDDLALEFGNLLDQLAISTKNPLLQKALKIEFVKEKIAGILADKAYEEIATGKMTEHLNKGFEAVLKNIGLKNAEIQTKTVNGIALHTLKDTSTKEVMKDFQFKVAKTHTPQEIEIKNKAKNKEIDSLVRKVGTGIILDPIRQRLKTMWFHFQDFFDRACNKIDRTFKIALGGRTKLFLDKVCRWAFDYTAGILMKAIYKRIKEISQNQLSKASEKALEAITESYDSDLIENSGKAILKIFESNESSAVK